MNRRGHCFHQLFGTLEGDGASQTDGEIGEIAIAGAANSHAPDFEHAIHAGDSIGDLGADAGGSGVEQSIDGAAGQAPAHRNDDAGDEQSGDGIGNAKPIQMINAPQQDEHQTDHDYAR